MCAVQGEMEEKVSHLVRGTLSGLYIDLKCESIHLSMLKSSLQIALMQSHICAGNIACMVGRIVSMGPVTI